MTGSSGPELRSERLLLRRWRDADRAPFARLNADPKVVEHLPAAMTRAESDATVDRIEAHFAARGFGFWAVELCAEKQLLGFVGLQVPSFEAAFTPCVEVGWRLAAEHWGHGYATEAAKTALAYAFGPLALDEVVSFTVPDNTPSRRVMERIGMHHAPESDFEHPGLPEGHRLRRHVFYRIGRAAFRQGES